MTKNIVCKAELISRDLLFIEEVDGIETLHAISCPLTISLIKDYQIKHGDKIKNWPVPSGSSHEQILLRELIQKYKNNWIFPYKHEEICHCRSVLTERVDQAIIAGAHRTEDVSRLTGASTACGTCRPDVQKIIDFRLNKNL